MSSADDPPHGSALASIASPYARARAHRWSPVPPELDAAIAADAPLAAAARAARERLVAAVGSRLGELPRRYLDALREVPRERFVLPEDIDASAEDVPLSLDPYGLATVSAPHAYLLTFRLLELSEGDHLLELGTGTGYGAALASHIVGESGRVTTVEIDAALFARAQRLLQGTDRIALLHGDARTLAPEVLARHGAVPNKIAFTFAIGSIPEAVESALPERGIVVAPVGAHEDDQELVRCERRNHVLFVTRHGAVRYVAERA